MNGTISNKKELSQAREDHFMKIGSHLIASFGGEIFLFASSFLLGVLTARYLGADGKGMFNVVTSAVFMLSTIFSLRFQRATTYYVSKYKDSLGEVIASSLLLGFVSTILILLVSFLFPEFFYSTLMKGTEIQWNILAILCVASYLHGVVIALLAGLQLFRERALLMGGSFLLRSVLVVLTFGLIKGNLNDLFLIMGWVDAILYTLVLALLMPRVKSFRIRGKPLVEMLKYALGAFPGMLSDLVTLRVDLFFINFFAGASQVGIYTVAISVANMFLYIPNATRAVLTPYIASQGNSKITSRLSRLILITLTGMSVILIPIFWVALVFVYGSQFAYSRILFLILLPGSFFWGIFTLLSSDFEGRGIPWKVSIISTITAIITVVLNVLLIPYLAATGAAITSSITYGLAMMMAIYLYNRETGTRITEILIPTKEDFSLLFSVASRILSRIYNMRFGLSLRDEVKKTS